MIVSLRLKGKWDGKKYVFSFPTVFKLYHGSVAHAKGSTQTSEFVPTGPWSQQIPYIQQLFQGASTQLGQGPPQYFPGSTVAPTNPTLAGSQENTIQTTGQTTPVVQGALEQAAQNQQTPTLAGMAGLGSIPTFLQSLGNLGNIGGTDVSNALNTALNSSGLNPYTDQIVDAALRNQNRQYSQNVLPGISSGGTLAGQFGGSRQGIAEGMAAQNQAQLQTDLIAQLLGQAFQTGSAERMGALGLISGAAQGAGGLAGNMIGTGSAQNIQSQVQNAAVIPGLNQAINTNLGLGNQVGLQQQAADQAARDAAVERWFFEQFAPYNLLTQYQNWVTGPYGASRDTGNTPYSFSL